MTLVASAVRLAESIGLHRDGKEYGYSPIAVHVRRQVWHQLCFLDIRTTESVGPRPVIRAEDYSTDVPLNVNDYDAEHEGQDRDSFTDMTSSIVDMRCVEAIRSLYPDRANIQTVDDGKIPLDQLLSKVEEFREKLLKEYGSMIDERVPIQRFTRLKIDLYTSRMYAMIFQRHWFNAHSELPSESTPLLLPLPTLTLRN